ncbi:hypothetical protein [Nonomuraea diastatica]|uniref:hypothetical protein n=1 Tax=Nonomuraea diastatica TaxID=1848329 RepID=UPI00104F8685|nr:hypothetical protein [Nonomuraea diastatica]
MIEQDRRDEGQAVDFARTDDQFCRSVAGVDVVLARQQPTLVQVLMDLLGHRHVGHGGVGGRHVRDQIRRRDCFAAAAVLTFHVVVHGVVHGVHGVAGFADVELVAVPEHRIALGVPAGIGVIRGGQTRSARRQSLPPSSRGRRRLTTSRPFRSVTRT